MLSISPNGENKIQNEKITDSYVIFINRNLFKDDWTFSDQTEPVAVCFWIDILLKFIRYIL